MIEQIMPYLGLGLALFGIGWGMWQARKFTKYEPLVKRALSIVGSLGKEKEIENRVAGEIEGAFQESAISALSQKYPEIQLVLGWLEENQPEVFDKIRENPQVIVGLIKKYAPLIEQIIGKGEKRQAKWYDV